MKDISWDNIYTSGKDFRPPSIHEVNFIIEKAGLHKDQTVLDVGCGTGQLTREMFHRGLDPTGIDISAKAIEVARQATVFSIQYNQVNFESNEITALENKKYDLITCRLVYAFISNKIQFHENVNRLLAANGNLVIISPLRHLTPKHKQHIAVNRTEALENLQNIYTVESYTKFDLGFFICKRR